MCVGTSTYNKSVLASSKDVKLPCEKRLRIWGDASVLYHVPDTAQGIRDCVRMLKPSAPFLLYLYYALDNRSFMYRSLWKTSDLFRKIICKLPHPLRYFFSQLIAFFVYWPLSRFAALMQLLGLSSEKAAALPLGFYRHLSFYTMHTDALDRFGTPLEQRFTRKQIQIMMESAGLVGYTLFRRFTFLVCRWYTEQLEYVRFSRLSEPKL